MNEPTLEQKNDPDWLLAEDNRVWAVETGYLVNALENAVEQRNAARQQVRDGLAAVAVLREWVRKVKDNYCGCGDYLPQVFRDEAEILLKKDS